jgi:transcriptional regulator with GAF, ATPase, and Fis domain
MLAVPGTEAASAARPFVVTPGPARDVHDLPAAADRTWLDLQRLIADLADRLVTVDADAIDQAITEGLRGMAGLLQLDHAILWREAGTEASALAAFTSTRRAAPREPLSLASIPFVASALRAGATTWFARLEDVPDPVDRISFLRQGIRGAAVVPLPRRADLGDERHALVFASTSADYEWTAAIIEHLRLVAGILGLALTRKAGQEDLGRALDPAMALCEPVPAKADQHRQDVKGLQGSRLGVSFSPTVRLALAQVEQVAPTNATVLLIGETGVGKEVFARTIHDLSPRHQRPLIRVNCAAIPSALIESELFGRERGAYTGAIARQIGRFEAANQSTILLDEIGELPADVQAKLLGVLQERVIERLGSTQSIKIDVRIIAATNRNLEKAVEDKLFREDLYYRLNVFPIVVPPLRERVEDIPVLAWQFIDEFSKSLGKPIESISGDSMRQLERYTWPGNVRELRNVIERAVILATGPRLTVPIPQPAVPRQSSLANLELEHIRTTLESTNWRIRGKGGAADRLGLKPTTLESRIAKLGLVRPEGSRKNPSPSIVGRR